MKHLLIIAITFIATLVQAEEQKITGTFESVRLDVLMGLPEPKKRDDIFEKGKQTVIITDKDITLSTGFGGSIYLTYTSQGDFLLAKTMIGQTEMFYPIYVKDDDTLFLAAQKFLRKKAATN